MIDRRRFCAGSVAALAAWQRTPAEQTAVAGSVFEAWRKGWLDTHHISTGRGNSTLAICPDGTSIMIDAGAVRSSAEAMNPARPNATRRPGEWIARYAAHHLRTTPRQELDFFVLTHFHGDHMGDLMPDSPMSDAGKYRLTGVSDVAALVPIRTLIDRGFPDYSYPAKQTYDGTLNYIAFARSAAANGTRVERLRPGSRRQIALQHEAAEFPSFAAINLAVNGEVWSGHGEQTVKHFPALTSLRPESYPSENACSIALRLDYGKFRYYAGGDLVCDTAFGTAPWMDIETAVARVAGSVQVAALDHHGYFDADGPAFVRAMRARIYIAQTWHASHPALAVLDRLYSPILYTGPRDVLATDLTPAAGLADDRYARRMLSRHGHIVVRVQPGGERYELVVLDDEAEDGLVKASFGPYAC